MARSTPADVAIWGRIPPPIGGMAVHLQRLIPHLQAAGISVHMYSVGRTTTEHPQVSQVSQRRLRWLLGQLFWCSEPLHYVLSDSTLARSAAACLSFFGRSKVILRVGGASLEQAAASGSLLQRCMVLFAIRNASAVIGVNEKICGLASTLGAKRVLHVPGFIAGDFENTPVPIEVHAFLDTGAGPVALASGEVQAKGDDLYGAYRLLDLLERLPNLRLVFYAYRITLGAEPQDLLAQEVQRRGLQARFLLFRSATDLVPAMRRCDLMVRPTTSDGDSNAIREALHLNLPVVASNCVQRPDGVITYPMQDDHGLAATVIRVLNDLEGERQRLHLLPKPDYARPIVKLMHELLGREP